MYTLPLNPSQTSNSLQNVKLCKEFNIELATPLADIFNCSLEQGIYPSQWKIEYVSPAPKVYPPKSTSDLRKISCTKAFSKIFEKFISEWILEDMTPVLDKSNYGGLPGRGTDHYLVNLIHNVLKNLDNNKRDGPRAAICQMYDWAKAFDNQDHTLGIQSFIDNNVRNSLIPILINYMEHRKMVVSWNHAKSEIKELPGGGAQGTLLGPLEYLSQSNKSADSVPLTDKFKYIDDLSVIEIIQLASKIVSYNFKNHVASDIGIHGQYLPGKELLSQYYADSIQNWTTQQKMQLNEAKSKYIVFNYTNNFHFDTRIFINNILLECVESTKLLGVYIQNNLKWDSNTREIIKKGYARMRLITNLIKFDVPQNDLVLIYILFIRSLLENCCVVWHSSLTNEQSTDIERVQKVAIRTILLDYEIEYDEALLKVNLQRLDTRREELCLNFSKKCTKSKKNSNMFPLNSTNRTSKEKFHVPMAHTERFKNSAIPYMSQLLNKFKI